MSEPIALPAAAHQQDYNMDPGSYTGENGQFNPQSYTRHFLGSPISWRAGSFGAQYCTSQSPTAMLVGSYDPVKPPQDSSIINAWNVFDRQGELCRNYTCCGMHLPDLHALLEHFEEVHIVVLDRAQPPQIQIPFNPQVVPPETTPQPPHHQPAYSTPFDTDDMDLGLDYEDASPPPPSTAPTSTVTSRAPSPSPSPSEGGVQRPALNISLTAFPFREGIHHAHAHTPLSASVGPFSAYARYTANANAEYPSPSSASNPGMPITSQDVADYTPERDATAIAPALVFATGEELGVGAAGTSQTSAASGSRVKTTTSKRMRSGPPSPSSRAGTPTASASSSALPSPSVTTSHPGFPSASTSTPTASSSTAPSTAAAAPNTNPTILLPHKPFRCPKPNCSKSYKQANGLKYHMTHGSCNFGPAKDVEAVRALLERKRERAGGGSGATTPTATAQNLAQQQVEEEEEAMGASTPGANGTAQPELSPADLTELEARVRPFACGVGDCVRRYKNMNGLRYHYQHSGDHGAVGLSLLAGGVHGCLKAQAQQGASVGGKTTPAGTGATPTTPSGTYAWGSTLLPHIQAVAAGPAPAAASTPTTPTSATTTAPTPTPIAAGKAGKNPKAKGNGKGKTEATPFTPPSSAVLNAAGASSSSAVSSPVSAAPAAPTPASVSAAPTPTPTQAQTAEYLALQRAQYAQYQQAVAAGWYVQQAQAQAQAAQMQAQQQLHAQVQQAGQQMQGQGQGQGQVGGQMGQMQMQMQVDVQMG
ncbi:hypothetical protein B0H11DRAFT_2231403 [Mycena galericulata]|nr:hypothetical protein B0H11DRAFT_2231403 [Mycena galericulata]